MESLLKSLQHKQNALNKLTDCRGMPQALRESQGEEMKHILTLLLIVISAVFTGCRIHNETKRWDDEGRIVPIAKISSDFSIYCDKSTNIAYLIYWGAQRAGITPYLNSEGQPSRCNEIHR